MNKVIQTVTLVNDPTVKTYGGDKSLVTFRGAVSKRMVKEGQPNANFFSYVAYGKTADFINKYFKKGSHMQIIGEPENNDYEKDGVKHYGVQIVIDSVEFLPGGKKNADNTAAPAAEAKTEAPVAEATPEAPDVGGADGYLDF